MKLWISNLTPGTTDDEITAFVKKYGPELECTSIQREEGDGSRPAAGLEFSAPSKALGDLNLRLNGFTCAYLATPYARRLSGETLYVDGGVNIMA